MGEKIPEKLIGEWHEIGLDSPVEYIRKDIVDKKIREIKDSLEDLKKGIELEWYSKGYDDGGKQIMLELSKIIAEKDNEIRNLKTQLETYRVRGV